MDSQAIPEYLRLQQFQLQGEVDRVSHQDIPEVSTIIHRKNLREYLHDVIFPLKEKSTIYPELLCNTEWANKHDFNFPGPFYTGESDSCGTGHIQAPNNVLYAQHFAEFIFVQPRNLVELFAVINAAAVEVWDSYSCDGNEYWTVAKCREWWRTRFDIVAELSTIEVQTINGSRWRLFHDYLETNAKEDLERYCFFLDNGFYPGEDDKLLPRLK